MIAAHWSNWAECVQTTATCSRRTIGGSIDEPDQAGGSWTLVSVHLCGEILQVITVLHDIGGMLCQEWRVAPPLSQSSFVPLTNRAFGECSPTAGSIWLRAACAVAGVLGRRGFALESAAAPGGEGWGQGVVGRSCAGHGFGPSRRARTTAGLPLPGCSVGSGHPGRVSLRWDGVPRRCVVSQDGIALDVAHSRKERVNPELTGQVVAPDLLSSLVKLQAVGLRRVLISSTN